MTAAKVMDVIARLLDRDGQAADAVSACTRERLEGAPRLLRILKSECPDFWRRFPRHKWPKSWSNIEDPVVLLERNLYGHPFAGPLVGKSARFFIGIWVGQKVPNWECLFVHRKQGLFLSENVDVEIAWRKAENGSHVEEIDETCGSWRTNIIPWPYIYICGMYSKLMQDDLCCSNWKVTRVGEKSRKNRRVVVRHGRAFSNMHWKVLRTGKSKDRAQSFKSLHGRSSVQERETWIGWSIVKRILTNSLWMVVLGTKW